MAAGLVDGDATACLYLKQCGGLEAAAAIATAAAPGTGRAPCRAASAAALQLLNTAACSSDRVLQALPATGIHLACLDAITTSAAGRATSATSSATSATTSATSSAASHSSAGSQEGQAAAALLCTLSTAEGSRKLLSELLGAAPARLQQLLVRSAQLDAAAQALLLAALGNCCVDRATKQGFASIMQAGAAGADSPLVQQLAGMLQAGRHVEVVGRMVGNLCGDASCRQLLAASSGLVRSLCALLLGKQGKPQCTAAGSGGGGGVQLASASALYNLCTEAAAQQEVLRCCQLPALLQLLCRPGSGPPMLAARLAGILARLAKQPLACKLLQAPGTMEALVAALASSTSSRPAAGAAAEAAGPLQDGLVRALAQVSAGAGQALLQRLLQAGAAQALVQLLRQAAGAPGWAGAGAAAGLAGNAALCVGHLAGWQGSWAQLRELGTVDALLGVARAGRGDAASKNAAIALAKLAGDGEMMARLRELHGLEIIYSYVKP
jgi:hypothetical protein